MDDSPPISRRIAVGALAAAGVGYALFGPRPRKQNYAGRLVLDYWEKWTGQEALAMERIVDAFNASQDRLHVRYLTMSAIEQKAMVATAGGDPPDILGLGSWDIPIFAESGALTDITDLANRAGLTDDYYAAPTRPLVHHRGPRWALVNSCSTLALYCNLDHFREVGLDPDRLPGTLEELDAAAERLDRFEDASPGGGGRGRAGGRGSLVRAGFLHRDPGWWNWVWGYPFGATVFDEDTQTALAGSAENIRGYRWLQSYPRRLGPTRVTVFQSGFGNYNSADQGFVSGRVSMLLHGPFLVNVIKTFRPGLNYRAVPFPQIAALADPERPQGMLESDVLCIPRGSRHPEAAFEFLKFTQRREHVEALAIAHCKPSPLATTSPDFAARHPNNSIDVHNAIVRSPRAYLTPRIRVWQQYRFEFDQRIAAMWDLRETPEQVLPEIQSRAQALVDEVNRRRRLRAGEPDAGRPTPRVAPPT